MQDACIALDVTEKQFAAERGQCRLLRVVSLVPKMERFVECVCDSVFRRPAAQRV
jgi:hypothetical protein